MSTTKKMDLSDPQIIKDACEMSKAEFLKAYAGKATDGMLSLSWHNLRKTHMKTEGDAGSKKAEKGTKVTKQDKPKEKKEKVKKEAVPQAGVEEFLAIPSVKKIIEDTTISKSEKMRQLFILGKVKIGEVEKDITPSIVSKLTDGHYSFVYGVYQRWKNPEVKPEKAAKPEKVKKEKKGKAKKEKEEEPAVEPAPVNDAIADRLADTSEEEKEETIEEPAVAEVKPAKKKTAAPKKAAKK